MIENGNHETDEPELPADGRLSASGIDWEAVKLRLSRAHEAVAASGQLSDTQAKALMDRRSAELAQVPPADPDSSKILEVMSVRLGAEQLAIETRYVREVLTPEQITPLPGSPEFVVGLTNLRGEVLSVMDLGRLLGIAPAEGDPAHVLVLGEDRVELGVVADAVEEILRLPTEKVLDSPDAIATSSREFLWGVTHDGMLVLNGEALLAAERLFVDEN